MIMPIDQLYQLQLELHRVFPIARQLSGQAPFQVQTVTSETLADTSPEKIVEAWKDTLPESARLVELDRQALRMSATMEDGCAHWYAYFLID